MKHIGITLAFLALFSVACGTLSQTPEERRHNEELVLQRLDNRSYTIDINYMIPLRGPGRALTSPYSITVDGTTIISHLPYIGEARNVPYGGGKVLNFKDQIDEYADTGFQNDRRKIVFVTNNDEDIIMYTILISGNGNATVSVRCRNREDISYRGTLDPEKEIASDDSH